MKALVISLQKQGKTVSATYEMLTAARSLGAEVSTAVLAANAQPLAAELASRGGGKVLAVSNPVLDSFNDEIFAKVIAELITRHAPDIVLGPATFYGKALFARLAAFMGGMMTSDVTALKVEGDSVVVTRPSYGGSVVARVAPKSKGAPFFVTVRPKIFAESSSGAGEVVAETAADSCFVARGVVKEVRSESSGTLNLAEADVIVAVGRGVKGQENIPMIKDLAGALKAAFGASRAIVDAGWTEYSNQVGQTGKTVNPKLYFALGISGAIQHLVGMRSSQYIVAVNKDKDAPIFNIANYGVVGDIFEIVPALTRKFKAELA
jgi:electron transfer flavoprotein alpha subunit